jgi:hypothetical protein
MNKIVNALISPYEVFRNTKFIIYLNNINELRNIDKIYKEHKNLLDISRQNYCKATDAIKNENKRKKLCFSKMENNSHDINIQNKIKNKNYKTLHKYEIEKYNKNISDIKKRYDNIHIKIELADKSKIMFIKTSFDKYINYMNYYIKNIKDFLYIIENYISDGIYNKEQKHYFEEFSKLKGKNKIEEEKFICFNECDEKEKKIKIVGPKLNFHRERT